MTSTVEGAPLPPRSMGRSTWECHRRWKIAGKPVFHFREIPEALRGFEDGKSMKWTSSSLVDLSSIAMICHDMPKKWLTDGILVFKSVFSLAAVAISGAKFEENHVFFEWERIETTLFHIFCHRSYNQSAWQCSDGNCIKGDVCKHGMVWGYRLAVLPCLAGALEVCKVHDIQVWFVFFRQQINLVAFQGSLHTLRCKVQWKTDSWRDDRMILVASPLGSKIRCFGNHNMVI